MDEVVSEVEVLYDLFEEVFRGDLLDSLGSVCVGGGKRKIKVTTNTNVNVVIAGGLLLKSGEEIKETLSGRIITGRTVTVEGGSEHSFVFETEFCTDEFTFIGGNDLKIGYLEVFVNK